MPDWSKPLKEKVYTFNVALSRLRRAKDDARGHLSGTRRVVVRPAASLPGFSPELGTRSRTHHFLIHSPGCTVCQGKVVPLTSSQAAHVNVPESIFVCTHRAPVDRLELLSDKAIIKQLVDLFPWQQ